MNDKRRLAKKALIKFLVAVWTWNLIYQTKNKTIFVYIDSWRMKFQRLLNSFETLNQIRYCYKISKTCPERNWRPRISLPSQWRYFITKQNFKIIMFSVAKLFESRCKFIPGKERQGYFAERWMQNAECQMTLKPGGTPHMKAVGMLVGDFELNP